MACVFIKGFKILIDDEDLELVLSKRWQAHGDRDRTYFRHGYQSKESGRWRVKSFFMHRMILGFPDSSKMVDHKSGDTLDNRKANLRLCSPLENARNSKVRPSKVPNHLKGAYPYFNTGRWWSAIRINGLLVRLGTFDTDTEAHEAYCRAAAQHFGEFARFK